MICGRNINSLFSKYFISLWIIIFSFLVVIPRVTFSQETEASPQPTQVTSRSADEAYRLYIEALEDYETAHEIYLQKRSQYLQFGTLKSRQDAYDATLVMMKRRDDVVISYFAALSARANSAIGVPVSRAESLTLSLTAEIQWFKEHKASISSATSLEDLVNKTKEAESRWKSDEGLIYEVLSTVAYGKILDFSDRTNETFAALRQKLNDIRQETREEYQFSQKKFDILDRWVSEIEQRIAESKDVQVEAEDMISQFATKKGKGLNSYNQVITTLGEAQSLLKEASTFMNEIIREVKTKES